MSTKHDKKTWGYIVANEMNCVVNNAVYVNAQHRNRNTASRITSVQTNYVQHHVKNALLRERLRAKLSDKN